LPLYRFTSAAVAAICLAQTAPREGYIRAADNVRLFYRIGGDRPGTVVILHGGPGNTLDSIYPDLDPLARNRRIIAYDQRGSGRSDLVTNRSQLAVARHVQDLEAIRLHFQIDRLTVLGNSWGGTLAGFYAAKHPDRIERIILHSSGAPTRTLANQTAREVSRRIERRYDTAQRERFDELDDPQTWLKAPDPYTVCREFYRMLLPVFLAQSENPNRSKADLCSGPAEAVRRQLVVNSQINRSLGDWNLIPSLAAVKAPVLVIHGAADPIPLESAEAWTRALPNARLLIVENAGHLPHIEQPEIYFDAVERFLNGEWPPAARKR
jgi:proline iminopeptidase